MARSLNLTQRHLMDDTFTIHTEIILSASVLRNTSESAVRSLPEKPPQNGNLFRDVARLLSSKAGGGLCSRLEGLEPQLGHDLVDLANRCTNMCAFLKIRGNHWKSKTKSKLQRIISRPRNQLHKPDKNMHGFVRILAIFYHFQETHQMATLLWDKFSTYAVLHIWSRTQ